jgi:hypothetical protein
MRRTSEVEKRDRQLTLLALTRPELIKAAKNVALDLVTEHGEVTSPDVVAYLRRLGWGPLLDSVDLRFMGVVFRKGWRRVGWKTGRASPGSHARPVAVWARDV